MNTNYTSQPPIDPGPVWVVLPGSNLPVLVDYCPFTGTFYNFGDPSAYVPPVGTLFQRGTVRPEAGVQGIAA